MAREERQGSSRQFLLSEEVASVRVPVPLSMLACHWASVCVQQAVHTRHHLGLQEATSRWQKLTLRILEEP